MVGSQRGLFKIGSERCIPLIGHIAFGVIDRGTNLIQVRPTSLCPLSCIFCSTDAGPFSRYRQTEYVVKLKYLVEWFNALAEYKQVNDIEAHIDTVGDPLTYPELVELVKELSRNPRVKVISLQTHGSTLTERKVDLLEEAGLSRINLSIDALDPQLARYLSGTPWYDVDRVKKVAEYIVQNTRIDLLIAPVWVPGLNDAEIPRIIDYALKIGAGKTWPPLGIQKYVPHKFGRKPKRVSPMTWYKFYQKLREWEEEYGVKLVLRPDDFNIYKVRPLPPVFELGEKTTVKIVGPGWLKREWLAVARNRVVTLVDVPDMPPPVGKKAKVEVIRTKHSIYIAKLTA